MSYEEAVRAARATSEYCLRPVWVYHKGRGRYGYLHVDDARRKGISESDVEAVCLQGRRYELV